MFLSYSVAVVLCAYSMSTGFVSAQDLASTLPTDIWASLNESVGGRLSEGTPYAEPCFSYYSNDFSVSTIQPNSQLCEDIQLNYTEPFTLDAAFAGYTQVCMLLC